MVKHKILQPSLIRFTKYSIPKQFDDGRDCNSTVEKILKNEIIPDTIPPIRVINLKGIYYALDNRRLYVFRAAQYLGCSDFIPVTVESQCNVDWSVFDPKIEGRHIEFEDGGVTYPHWNDSWLEVKVITKPGKNDFLSADGSIKNTKIQQCRARGKYLPVDGSNVPSSDRDQLINAPETCCNAIFCCFSMADDDTT